MRLNRDDADQAIILLKSRFAANSRYISDLMMKTEDFPEQVIKEKLKAARNQEKILRRAIQDLRRDRTFSDWNSVRAVFVDWQNDYYGRAKKGKDPGTDYWAGLAHGMTLLIERIDA